MLNVISAENFNEHCNLYRTSFQVIVDILEEVARVQKPRRLMHVVNIQLDK